MQHGRVRWWFTRHTLKMAVLVILCAADTINIKEVLLFPAMKPQDDA